MGCRSPQLIIDGNGPLFRQGDARRFQMESCRVRTSTCGHQDRIRSQGMFRARRVGITHLCFLRRIP